jgi:mRNA interferase RelE/StbE
MTYDIQVSEAAKDFLKTIHKIDLKKIVKKIDQLTHDPRPRGVEKLSGEDDIYRIRSGDYRIIYHIRDKTLLVLVLKVGHRKNVYKKL